MSGRLWGLMEMGSTVFDDRGAAAGMTGPGRVGYLIKTIPVLVLPSSDRPPQLILHRLSFLLSPDSKALFFSEMRKRAYGCCVCSLLTAAGAGTVRDITGRVTLTKWGTYASITITCEHSHDR